VGPETAREPGTMTALEVGGERVALANVDGTVYAFGDACPHRQCSLAEGTLAGTVVTCPCHGSQFDIRTGERLRGPAVGVIPVFVVRDDGELDVVLS
jgi:nitrite reductase/ring-hydroxylating ferredoxin subunit